jgi:hypothetical protein
MKKLIRLFVERWRTAEDYDGLVLTIALTGLTFIFVPFLAGLVIWMIVGILVPS